LETNGWSEPCSRQRRSSPRRLRPAPRSGVGLRRASTGPVAERDVRTIAGRCGGPERHARRRAATARRGRWRPRCWTRRGGGARRGAADRVRPLRAAVGVDLTRGSARSRSTRTSSSTTMRSREWNASRRRSTVSAGDASVAASIGTRAASVHDDGTGDPRRTTTPRPSSSGPAHPPASPACADDDCAAGEGAAAGREGRGATTSSAAVASPPAAAARVPVPVPNAAASPSTTSARVPVSVAEAAASSPAVATATLARGVRGVSVAERERCQHSRTSSGRSCDSLQ
jgi:hypothetical protein